jgi:hypothetical protein
MKNEELKKLIDKKDEIHIDGNFELEENIDVQASLFVRGAILGTSWDINAGNITARNINAWDITAWDINAGNITARNITAWDITARNITAGDINYYAVCFAYKNIKCKSIKGRRKNAKYFCLDGKIEM